MKLYHFSVMFLGLIINWYFSYKAFKNLSEKGKERGIFFISWRSSDYFTPIGQKYLSLARKIGIPVGIFGFILAVILSYNNF